MLRTGICLLSSSSLGVLYRNAELTYSMSPALKWLCFFGLMTSLICFITTYIRVDLPRVRKIFQRHPDMIKSEAWKLSSMA